MSDPITEYHVLAEVRNLRGDRPDGESYSVETASADKARRQIEKREEVIRVVDVVEFTGEAPDHP